MGERENVAAGLVLAPLCSFKRVIVGRWDRRGVPPQTLAHLTGHVLQCPATDPGRALVYVRCLWYSLFFFQIDLRWALASNNGVRAWAFVLCCRFPQWFGLYSGMVLRSAGTRASLLEAITSS